MKVSFKPICLSSISEEENEQEGSKISYDWSRHNLIINEQSQIFVGISMPKTILLDLAWKSLLGV